MVRAAPLLLAVLLALLPRDADAAGYRWPDLLNPAKVDALLTGFMNQARSRPDDYEVHVKAATFAFYAWRLEKTDNRRRLSLAEACVRMSRAAVRIGPERAEGWHWLGVGLGAAGLTRGVLNSLQLVPDVRRVFEKSAELDPGYLDASALAQLGRLYTVVPGFPISIGDHKTALLRVTEAKRRSGGVQPVHYLYAADLLWAGGRFDEALAELDRFAALKPASEIQYFIAETSRNKVAEMRQRILAREKRDPFFDVVSDIPPGLAQ